VFRAIVLFSLVFLCLSWFGFSACSTPTPVKPLADPIFRLHTKLQGKDCGTPDNKKPCRYEVEGKIVSISVVSPDENPIKGCSNCSFNQKFGILDAAQAIHYVYYKLPNDGTVPLQENEVAKVLYIDAENIGQGHALTVHSKGQLLFAVTSGSGGLHLNEQNLNPIKISEDTGKVAGQETSECGTKLFRELIFEKSGNKLNLPPGQIQELKAGSETFQAGNVNRFNWQGYKCTDLAATPFSYFIYKSSSR